MSTTVLIILVLVILLFGGGWYGYRGYGYQGLGGVVGLILIILLVLFLTGTLGTARAQVNRQPVPILKVSRAEPTPAPLVQEPPPLVSRQVRRRTMDGATRCEQIGETITCDNGYTRQVR